MESEGSIHWGGIALSFQDYIRNLLYFSQYDATSTRPQEVKPLKKLAELQLKRLEDLGQIQPAANPAPMQHQVNLRVDRSVQTRVSRPPAQGLGMLAIVSDTQWVVAVAALALGVVALQVDVRARMEQAQRELDVKREACAKAYQNNECSPHTRIPVAAEFCESMELCISQTSVSSMQVFASVLGATLESFFAALSVRTLLMLGAFGLV